MHTAVLSALAVTRRMPSLRLLALTLALGLLFIAWAVLYVGLTPILAVRTFTTALHLTPAAIPTSALLGRAAECHR